MALRLKTRSSLQSTESLIVFFAVLVPLESPAASFREKVLSPRSFGQLTFTKRRVMTYQSFRLNAMSAGFSHSQRRLGENELFALLNSRHGAARSFCRRVTLVQSAAPVRFLLASPLHRGALLPCFHELFGPLPRVNRKKICLDWCHWCTP